MSFLLRLFGLGGERIDGARARELVTAGATLLDVRTPGEFGGHHLDGAVNIPVDQLPRRVSEVSGTVVVYCATGMRSAQARRTLLGAGLSEVHDLGGIRRW